LSINVGCLNLASNFLIDENTKPIAGNAGAKEKLLPPKECAEICLTIGTELEKGGYLADAAIQYEKVRKLDPKTQVVGRRLAVLYDQLGEERRALTEYDDALKRTPKDADLLNDYGYFHYSRGRWQPAETAFRQALAQNPTHERAIINLGMTLAQQGKLDEAMQTFVKINSQAQAKANIAFALATQGKRALAMQAYREALQIEPGLMSARQGLATLESGGKVNLIKGSPANRPNTQSVTQAMQANNIDVAAQSAVKDAAPDNVIGPTR
jgi:Tfp pilus assembly protein PilF